MSVAPRSARAARALAPRSVRAARALAPRSVRATRALAPRSVRAARALRVALDAPPLMGARTGVGTFVAGALPALAGNHQLDMRAYGLTWRGRRELAGLLPTAVGPVGLPMPAGLLLRVWARADEPAIEWWT